MPDQVDRRVAPVVLVVPVVLQQQGTVDDLLDERGQPFLDPVQRQPPVIAEREDRRGLVFLTGQTVSQLLGQVLVDERERTAGRDPGRL